MTKKDLTIRILTENAILLAGDDELLVDPNATKYLRDNAVGLRISKFIFYSSNSGFFMRRGIPWGRDFNTFIRRIFESGVTSFWDDKIVSGQTMTYIKTSFKKEMKDETALQIRHFVISLSFLSVGLFFALAIFIMEYFKVF